MQSIEITDPSLPKDFTILFLRVVALFCSESCMQTYAKEVVGSNHAQVKQGAQVIMKT